MALTSRLVAYVYSVNGNATTLAGGNFNSLPSNLCQFYAAPSGTTVNGVTMGSVILLLPSGLNQTKTTFLTDSTPTQLGTNGS